MKRGACGKVCYPNRQAAKRALATYITIGGNSRRLYYCKTCGVYHLTSQT